MTERQEVEAVAAILREHSIFKSIVDDTASPTQQEIDWNRHIWQRAAANSVAEWLLENVERIRAALGAPSSAPEGPWKASRIDSARWEVVLTDEDGLTTVLDPFTEAEAIAVRDALNAVAARVNREGARQP